MSISRPACRARRRSRALDPTSAALQAATAAATAAAGEDKELAAGSAALVTWVYNAPALA